MELVGQNDDAKNERRCSRWRPTDCGRWVEVLAHGGNAVDAAIASMTTAFVSEPHSPGRSVAARRYCRPKSPPKATIFLQMRRDKRPSPNNLGLSWAGS